MRWHPAGVALLALALTALACRPVTPAGARPLQARLGQWVRLAPGQAVSVDGLTLRFLDVPHDSRCPRGARCVWAGVARIRVEWSEGGRSRVVVLEQGGLTSSARQRVDRYLLTFNLEPHPDYEKAITPRQYRLRLRVERKEAPDG